MTEEQRLYKIAEELEYFSQKEFSEFLEGLSKIWQSDSQKKYREQGEEVRKKIFCAAVNIQRAARELEEERRAEENDRK